MRDLPTLLDRLEEAGGPADPVPSADGWELVLAESVACVVDDQRRWHALDELRRVARGAAPSLSPRNTYVRRY
jgi:hypothetical protein